MSLADQIIVTDDNPRSEDPQAITRDILQGIKSREVRVIHDRGEAIATALKEAQAIDLVLIAGKGHEDYQIYGETRRAFSDRSEALRVCWEPRHETNLERCRKGDRRRTHRRGPSLRLCLHRQPHLEARRAVRGVARSEF